MNIAVFACNSSYSQLPVSMVKFTLPCSWFNLWHNTKDETFNMHTMIQLLEKTEVTLKLDHRPTFLQRWVYSEAWTALHSPSMIALVSRYQEKMCAVLYLRSRNLSAAGMIAEFLTTFFRLLTGGAYEAKLLPWYEAIWHTPVWLFDWVTQDICIHSPIFLPLHFGKLPVKTQSQSGLAPIFSGDFVAILCNPRFVAKD